MRGVGLAVASAMVFSLSGCVDVLGFVAEGGEGRAITVPPLMHGESWSTTSRITNTDGAGDAETTMTQSTKVRDGTHVRLDAYGFPVSVILLSEDTAVQTIDLGQIGSMRFENLGERAIESSGGNILITGTYSWTHEFKPTAGFEFCKATVEDTALSYASKPVRYGATSLRGETLRMGDVVVREQVFEDSHGAWRLRKTFTAVETRDLTLTLDGQRVTKPGLIFDVTSEVIDPAGVSDERSKVTARVGYADGVGVPVIGETLYSETVRGDYALTEYASGHTPVQFGGPMQARFQGTHPEASVAKFDRTPQLSGVAFEFSLSAAMDAAVLAAEPNYLLWRQANPTALLSSGLYERDPARNVYSWQWRETDGIKVWDLRVTRETRAGIDLLQARAKNWEGQSWWAVDPSKVRESVWVDAKTALNVAEKFLPADSQWGSFGWDIQKMPHDDEPRMSYTVSLIDRTWSGGAGPVKTEMKEVSSPQREIDPLRGALSAGGGLSMGCGRGLILDLPL